MQDILGKNYTQQQLDLAAGHLATLISRPADANTTPRGAMLYIHGFVDYFFQDHVASHFTAQGWAWYALDLRRNGRSLRPGQEPWYTNDITEYYEEIDLAIEHIKTDGHDRVVLMGHSTGGLVSALWAHDRRDPSPIDALILNSPWLDLQEPWLVRTLGTWIIRGVGSIFPLMNAPRGLGGVYAQSIHKSANGEWDFDPRWKPLTPQPVKMGFLASVRREQARLHRGLEVQVPVLMLRSEVSRLDITNWHDDAHAADLVLDVEQMKLWLPKIGRDITDIPLARGIHDVMLSVEDVRSRALAEIDSWLNLSLGEPSAPAAL